MKSISFILTLFVVHREKSGPSETAGDQQVGFFPALLHLAVPLLGALARQALVNRSKSPRFTVNSRAARNDP
jgi:hypothetical protein